ncbi:MAG: hypothetical protein OEO23_16090, partial [Gemmatimonadota bacterium]|nr:hypothetical protein [Gemmatimonadota bacterium]
PTVADGGEVGEAGEIVVADPKRGLAVATAIGEVAVGEVQPPGKRRMSALQWVQGRGAAVGDRFQ